MNFINFLKTANKKILLKLKEWDNSLSVDSNNESNPKNFEDLTPKNDLPADEYSEALEWALTNSNITNIALTGTYGSGKSSIIKSFQARNSEYKYLNISLASFGLDEAEIDSSLNRKIERSILQQIFYRAKPNEVPESRFQRIFSVSRKRVMGVSLLLILWLFSLVTVFELNDINPLFNWVNINGISDDINKILVVVFLLGVIWILGFIIRLFHNLSFSKLNITKDGIEIAEELDSSILNDHLEEILYFFEVQKYNVVVIEDIDRFDSESIEIFTKLREINILLNQSKQVDRRIVFIYALRDELFQNIQDKYQKNNRTKFFDFMIPVIPVINSNNSGEKLVEKLSDQIDEGVLSKQFIFAISIFINDMRLLKNVYNEYIIYENKLSDIGLNKESLFSIIVYKNLLPDDFSDLQNSKGMFYDAIQNKQKLISEIKKELNEKINDKEIEIERIDNENLKSIKELRGIYLLEFIKLITRKNDGVKSIYLDGQARKLNDCVTDDYFDEFVNLKDINYTSVKNNRNTRSNLNFNDIENSIGGKLSYNEREKLLFNKHNKRKEHLKREIETIRAEINQLNSKKIAEILNDNNKVKLLGEELLNHELLVFIIKSGYLDEDTYKNYISYFYEGSLKREDMTFIQSVINGKSLDWNFSLSKTNEIINRLKTGYFDKKEILNADLLKFLVDNQSVYKAKFDLVLKKLTDESNESVEFIDKFLSKYAEEISLIEDFIRNICSKWSGIWNYIENRSSYTKEKKEDYFKLIINHAHQSDIVEINLSSDNELKQYIENKKDLLSIIDSKFDINKVKDLLINLQVKFNSLEDIPDESELWQFIVKEDLYSINIHMITQILRKEGRYSEETIEKLQLAPFSLIKGSEQDSLIKYVESEIEKFVKKVSLKNDSLKEDEKYFIELLNNEALTLELKTKILELQSDRITEITQVSDKEVWKELFKFDKADSIWPNIFEYYQEYKNLDGSIIEYLNREENYKELSKEMMNSYDFSEDQISELSKEIILNKEISDDSFQYLIKSIPHSYNELAFELLSNFKIETMINNGFLNITPSNYKLLRSDFSPLHIKLVESDLNRFKSNIAEYVVNEEDLKVFLSSSEIKDVDKLEIFKHKYDDSTNIDQELAELILGMLLSNRAYKVSFELANEIIEKAESKDLKVKFITTQIDFFENKYIKALLKILPYPYFRMVKSRKQPKIENNPINLLLVKKLKKRNIISSYKEIDNNKIRVFARIQ